MEQGSDDMLPAVEFLPNPRGPEQAAEAATDRLFVELRTWLEDTLRPLASELELLRRRQRRCELALGLEDLHPPVRGGQEPTVPQVTPLLQQVEELLARETKELHEHVVAEVAKSHVKQRTGLDELRSQQAELHTAIKADVGSIQVSGDELRKLQEELDSCRQRLDEVASGTPKKRGWFGCMGSRSNDRGPPSGGGKAGASTNKGGTEAAAGVKAKHR